MKQRIDSTCPIALSLDLLGDKWSLVILRDILFNDKKHFRELLKSSEKISTNILSARLESLVIDGFLTKHSDPANKSAAIYKPTQKSLDLMPILFEFIKWGVKHHSGSDSTPEGIQMVLKDSSSVSDMVLARFNA